MRIEKSTFCIGNRFRAQAPRQPAPIGRKIAAFEKGYELSPEARDDLQEIWIYIAGDNLAAADQLEADIYQACEILAENPRLGHKRPDLTDEPVLFWPVWRRATARGRKDLAFVSDQDST